MSSTLNTITVAELIELLQNEDPQARVVFSCNYGDYGRTQQALGIEGWTEERQVEESAYSDSGFAIKRDRSDEDWEEGEDEEDEEKQPTVLVIR